MTDLVKLVSEDKQTFEVEKKYLLRYEFFNTLLGGDTEFFTDMSGGIPIAMHGDVLQHLLEWIKTYDTRTNGGVDDEPPPGDPAAVIRVDLGNDQQFLESFPVGPRLFEILFGAGYLDLHDLQTAVLLKLAKERNKNEEAFMAAVQLGPNDDFKFPYLLNNN